MTMKMKNQGRWKTSFYLAAGLALVFLLSGAEISFAVKPVQLQAGQPIVVKKPVVAQLSLEQAQKAMTTKIYKGKIGKRALYANPELK
jgi:hypothetical protein